MVRLLTMGSEVPFSAAKPVWPVGREREMNRFVGIRGVIDAPAAPGVTLRITASTVYRAFVNGQFLGCGPARAAHGYFRVDEWPMDTLWRDERNLIAIEAVGYNINSYYLLDQPAFVQAEVVNAAGKVLAATGIRASDFSAFLLDDHVQKVERYSAARTFSEIFRLHGDSYDWRTKIEFGGNAVPCSIFPLMRLLPRRVPYPDFAIAHPQSGVSCGYIDRIEPRELRRDWTLTHIGPDLKGFEESELNVIPSLELQKLRSITTGALDMHFPLVLQPMRFATLQLGVNLTGFIRLMFRCERPSRIAIVFDEVLTPDGDVCFNRLRCNNVIWIDAEPGSHEVETFEPYTMRFVKLICLDGSACQIDEVALRRYEHPPLSHVRFECNDEGLVRIFDAGVSTFRQNAVDLPMDCPSRERSAWLCDSFFTCRTAFELTGSTAIETNFLENYLLPDRFEHLPDGMVPMNYPADHPNGKFIPNWALWLVLQLEEYLSRSGDREMIDAFRHRVEGILRYFDRFLNSDGLLERLESWIFVEWSRANDFVQDVNYPTNMLYAAALDAAGRVYEREDWLDAAERVQQVVREQSFDGEFFVDNAMRERVRLVPTRNRTEVCQYHAFYFDIASPQLHPQLWRRLIDDFGPKRAAAGAFPEIHPANALMGFTMRLELLDRYNLSEQLRDEICQYYLTMAETTGTLWEHSSPTASCNHGFASHVCRWLLRRRQRLASQ